MQLYIIWQKQLTFTHRGIVKLVITVISRHLISSWLSIRQNVCHFCFFPFVSCSVLNSIEREPRFTAPVQITWGKSKIKARGNSNALKTNRIPCLRFRLCSEWNCRATEGAPRQLQQENSLLIDQRLDQDVIVNERACEVPHEGNQCGWMVGSLRFTTLPPAKIDAPPLPPPVWWLYPTRNI